MNNKRKLTTRDIVYIGLLSAICAVATTIHIELGSIGMVHLGSGAIFTTAILFGGVFAGFAGAVGSALFDLVMGYSPYTVWSFFIKGIAGLIVGTVASGLWPEKVAFSPALGSWVPRALAGCFLGALWTLGGYILAWWQVLGSLPAALMRIPSSLLTSGVGVVIAIFICIALRNKVRY